MPRASLAAALVATLLSAAALGQDVDAVPVGNGTSDAAADSAHQSSSSSAAQGLQVLPPPEKCWGAVTEMLTGGAGEAADGTFEALAACTPQETDPTLCCSFMSLFAPGSPEAGCLCIETFFNGLVALVEGNAAAALIGPDVDIYLWAERCVQAGYQVPVVGNSFCPESSQEETQCGSPSSEPASVAEGEALLQLVDSKSSALPSWTVDNHVCCWEGITCNTDERVVNLELREDVGLTGTLPEDFSRISYLRSLTLLEADLSGTLPPSWSTLSNLRRLYIPHQHISGTLPAEFSVMRQMEQLILPGNSLTGTLPSTYSSYETGSNLILDLSNNKLTGTLPQTWSGLTTVSQLLLEDNDLDGTLPSEWSKMGEMTNLVLAGNRQLHGTLPKEWSTWSLCLLILMADQQLEGSLPIQWSAMTRLQVLWLGGNSLTGTSPKEWSALSKLHHLSLKSNLLTGSLPPEWSASELNTFYVSNNWLTGSMPDCWAPDGGPDYLAEGFLDFRLNFFSAAPDAYEATDNMYNCLPGKGSQRLCPPPWQAVMMLLVLLLCLVGTLLLEIAVSGRRVAILEFRFSIQQFVKAPKHLRFTKSRLLLLAVVVVLSQRVFILSPYFMMAGRAFHRQVKVYYVKQVGSEILNLLSGTILSVFSVVPLLIVVIAFLWRGALALVPYPEWLPKNVARMAWTLVASEDVLRDNLQAMKIDQLLLLTVFLVASMLVPLSVATGLQQVIISREVDASVAWDVNSTKYTSVLLPRNMLAVLIGSMIISIYSMLSAILLMGSVVWSSVAVNEAIRAGEVSSRAQQNLKQLRWLRRAFPQALLSLIMCTVAMVVFLVAPWQDMDIDGVPSLTWGSTAETAAIVALVGVQALSVAGWNISAWGSTNCSKWAAVESNYSFHPDEEAVSLSPSDEQIKCASSNLSNNEIKTLPNGCEAAADRMTASTPVSRATKQAAPRESGLLRWLLPQVHLISQTRARNNALLLVVVLQMVHVEEGSAGLPVAWATWLISVAILCWAVLVRDAPKGFHDIHESAAFGMVVLAKDLAAVLEADLKASDIENDSVHDSVRAFESFREPDSDCCADYPAGCPRCQLLLRRVPATLFRMQETMCVSYRWQRQVRAVVRPQGQPPLASSSGVRNQVVGINMTRWQRSQLLAAILRSSCTYVWLDVLSIPAALRPEEGSRLWELSEKLMSRMMAVYSAATSTLVLLSKEKEGTRYCQRAWTMQEYCGARALDVVCQSGSSAEASLVRDQTQTFRTRLMSRFAVLEGQSLTAFRDEEVERYRELRKYVRQSMAKAVPLWILVLLGTDVNIEDAQHRAGVLASVMDNVTCEQPVDLVRALVPVLLNTSVQNMEELCVLVRAASNMCPADSESGEAMKISRQLLGLEAA